MPKKTSITNVIVERTLDRTDAKGGPITIKIGTPRQVSEEEWECPFYITNIGIESVLYGYGVDSFQALLLAIKGARYTLEKCKIPLTWIYGEKGDIGLPIYLPDFINTKLTDRLRKLTDKEVRNYYRSLRKKHKLQTQKAKK